MKFFLAIPPFGLRILFLGLSILCHSAIASAQFNNYPGGIVELSINKESTELPEVKFGLKNVTILDRGNQWRVLIGIDLNTLPGDYLLYVKQPNDDTPAFDRKFSVAQKMPLFIDQEVTADLPVAHLHDKFSDIQFSNTVEPELPLIYPAQGQWTDQFGAINILEDGGNAEPRNYVSLSTTKVLTVAAPQNAIVSKIVATQTALVDSRGNFDAPSDTDTNNTYTLYLDHGRGLYSILTGVMDITIETGNGVLAGAVLGKIYTDDTDGNQTSTLIWQTVLNDTYVNPLLLTELR